MLSLLRLPCPLTLTRGAQRLELGRNAPHPFGAKRRPAASTVACILWSRGWEPSHVWVEKWPREGGEREGERDREGGVSPAGFALQATLPGESLAGSLAGARYFALRLAWAPRVGWGGRLWSDLRCS